MNVEQLYWKLKELRDQGHADKEVVILVYDDEGDQEYIDTVDHVDVEIPGRVFLTGDDRA